LFALVPHFGIDAESAAAGTAIATAATAAVAAAITTAVAAMAAAATLTAAAAAQKRILEWRWDPWRRRMKKIQNA